MQEIKKGWKKVRIGELTEVLNGGTPSTTECDYWDGNILWFTPKDLSDYKESKYISNSIKKITDLGLKKSSAKIVPKNSIILSSRAPVGYVNIITEDFTTNQGCKSLICNDLVNNQFLYYWLKINTETLENVSGGATFKELRTQSLKDLEIILPPLPTQQKIASILSKYDDLIENNNKRIKILEETAQAIYEEWFVKYNFPGNENIKMIDSGNDDFGMIPEGWEVKKVEEMIKKLPTGKKYDNKTVQEKGNIPVLDQGKSGIIGYHNEEPGVIASIENPIITFANHTCYQKIIMYPFSSIQNIFALISCNENKSNIFWLHYATKDLIKFNDYKGHMPEFITKKLLYPGFNLTEKFGDKIKGMIFEIYNLQKQNQNLKETRDLLIPRLVSGELDVENLDVK